MKKINGYYIKEFKSEGKNQEMFSLDGVCWSNQPQALSGSLDREVRSSKKVEEKK